MLKKRIIATLLLKNDLVVQSIGFKRYLPIGKLDVALQFLERWDIDEVVILDIDASRQNRTINFDLIKQTSKNIYVPITVGGGISSIKEIEKAIHSGADKVSVNTAFYDDHSFIKKATEVFGKQCLVLSADVMKENADYYVYKNKKQQMKLNTWVEEVQSVGAGEILLNSITNDGLKSGYDIEMINSVKDIVNVPLIALGGAGNITHIQNLFEQSSVDAAAVGNMLHFTEHSTSKIKSFLIQKEQKVRPSCFIDYKNYKFDCDGRIASIEHPSIFIKE